MSRLLRAVAALTSLLLAGLGLVATAAPAAATMTVLCTGYDGCRALGMSNAGYKQASGTMWWRMYAGHNCTNYVAYRMVRSGLANVRPWSGGGNASRWGLANPTLTDSVPAVGAVAWWGANVRPAGSAGHVAYVEQVLSADEIIVSQDSWHGDFSWARITRAGGSWPSGFVHFNDVRLRNLAPPSVSGTPRVGSLLTASAGAWSQAGAAYAYQWRADGVVIANATGPTLRLGLAQQDKAIAVRVTASKLGFPTTSVRSVRTAAVEPGVITNTGRPTVTGVPKVDSTLTASPGTWNPAPTGLAYQWTADGAPVEGATTATLTPGPDLVGKALAVTVTASKDGYAEVAAASEPTGPVAPGTITVTAPATVTAPRSDSRFPRPGQTLTLDPGRFTPADAAVSVQWLRSGVPVEGATGSTYRLTPADLGARIAARVTLTKPGYTTVVTRTPRTRRVKADPRLSVGTTPGNGRLRVAVTVTAGGVEPVTGTLRIRWRGKLVEDVTLRHGAATIRLTGLPRGTGTLAVRYLGAESVTAETVRRTVRIG